MHRFSFAFAFMLAGVCLAACLSPEDGSLPASQPSDPSLPEASGPRIKAVTLDAVHPPPDTTLRAIKNLGATHLVLISFGFQPAADQPRIRMHTEGRWESESDAGIRRLARRAGEHGLELILKPHVWIGRDDQSRLDISFDTEADWKAWEKQYRRLLLHYAALAEEVEADMLVVGTELAGTSRVREDFWRRLIAEVRTVYAGRLTYAANWQGEFEAIPFWDALDLVGVQAYFPLAENDAGDLSLKALRRGWRPHLEALRDVARRTDRPVFLTELGYRSAPSAAATPWRWPSTGERVASAPALQARCYEAFFREVWLRRWLAGATVWKWHPTGEADRPTGFTPQGKPAAEVIRRGFEGITP